jgi:glycosyltransferase involved in cell wall biosynthesis
VARLGISAEFVRPGLVGGTEQALHYVVDGLIDNLAADDVVALIGRGTSFTDGPQLQVLEAPRPFRVRFVQETLTYHALAQSFDAYYFPNYFTPPVRKRCRTITTIPDLQYLHLPENFSLAKRLWLRAAHRATLRRADVVTVYSDFVRSDIVDRYGIGAASQIKVVPIPISWERFGDSRVKQINPRGRPYVLGVSSHYKHKNLATLLRAFGRVHRHMPDVELVLVGQLGNNLIGVTQAEDVPELVRKLRLDQAVRATGYIDPHTLGDLYRGAALFVFPSVFEGFGLPPVEALGLGLSVITTGCASLPEVTRGLADHVLDPFDDEELAELMLRRLQTPRRPTPLQVAEVRSFYSPRRIGAELYRLLTGP